MSARRSCSKHRHSQGSASINGVSQAHVMGRAIGFELGSHIGGGHKKTKIP